MLCKLRIDSSLKARAARQVVRRAIDRPVEAAASPRARSLPVAWVLASWLPRAARGSTERRPAALRCVAARSRHNAACADAMARRTSKAREPARRSTC